MAVVVRGTGGLAPGKHSLIHHAIGDECCCDELTLLAGPGGGQQGPARRDALQLRASTRFARLSISLVAQWRWTMGMKPAFLFTLRVEGKSRGA
eukprot:scaffold181564_cov21-Tisochrysis_lutea.AAC.1